MPLARQIPLPPGPQAAERRRAARFPVSDPGQAALTAGGRRHPCRIADISLGGLRLEVTAPLAPGAELILDHPEAGLFLGRCAWQADSGLGFQFTPVCPDLEHTLRCVNLVLGDAEDRKAS